MATNSYGRSCTPNLGGVSDFYTKSEINRLIGAKANTSVVYTRTFLDDKFLDISKSLSLLDSVKVDQDSLDSSLLGLRDEIYLNISSVYATLEGTYTKAEVDSLVDSLNLDPDTLVKVAPKTTLENTIYPGENDAVSLTVRGSNLNSVVFSVQDKDSNSIATYYNSGRVSLDGSVSIGRLTDTASAALDMNSRRITAVGQPVLGSDAVPFSLLQTYILDFYTEIARTGTLEFYALNAGEY